MARKPRKNQAATQPGGLAGNRPLTRNVPDPPPQQCFGFLQTQAPDARSACDGGPKAEPAAQADSDSPGLTRVALYWTKGVCEHWLRFGRPVSSQSSGGTRRIECYAPGQIFALVRWASNSHGTVLSRIDVLQAVAAGEPCTPIADVTPGAAVMLSAQSWRTVRRVFALIDAIEALGVDPCEIDPALWCAIHNRLPATSPKVSPVTRSGASLAQKADRK